MLWDLVVWNNKKIAYYYYVSKKMILLGNDFLELHDDMLCSMHFWLVMGRRGKKLRKRNFY